MTLMRMLGLFPAVSKLIGRGNRGASPQVADFTIAKWPARARIGASLANVRTW
jgi:hypothetical protein